MPFRTPSPHCTRMLSTQEEKRCDRYRDKLPHSSLYLNVIVKLIFFPSATNDVKENKESDKKADPFKEPPLESDALVRVNIEMRNMPQIS